MPVNLWNELALPIVVKSTFNTGVTIDLCCVPLV